MSGGVSGGCRRIRLGLQAAAIIPFPVSGFSPSDKTELPAAAIILFSVSGFT